MARPSAGNDEQSVDANVVAEPGVARRQLLHSRRDTAQAVMVQGKAGGVCGRALRDLAESDYPPAPGDQIDFAAANARPARQDSPTS